MTKTKRQLRAEAVERLNEVRYGGDAVEFCDALLGERWSGENLRERIADLLTDDELPEGDAVSRLREWLVDEVNENELKNTWFTVTEQVCKLDGMLDKIADMVERDYVRREYHCKVVDDSAKLFAKVLDERDEYRKAAKENLELCEKRRKERDELQAKLEETEFARDQAMDLVDDLGAERDEWKAKADKLTERMDKRENTMRRLAKLVDVTPEAEYAYNGDPQSVVDGGDFGELATLVFGAVRRLMSERGEWKAKADCVHDYEEGVCKRNPFIKKWTCRKCGHETLLSTQAEEWLLSPHSDPLSDSESSQREQESKPESATNDYGHSADMSENEPDCVRNDGFASENGVREPDGGSNDGKVSTMPLKMPGEIKWQYMDGESYRQDADQAERVESGSCENDTREKLEAEIDEVGNNTWWKAKVLEWLDRQAAITKRECESDRDYWDDCVTAAVCRGVEVCAKSHVGDYEALHRWYREKLGRIADAANDIYTEAMNVN